MTATNTNNSQTEAMKNAMTIFVGAALIFAALVYGAIKFLPTLSTTAAVGTVKHVSVEFRALSTGSNMATRSGNRSNNTYTPFFIFVDQQGEEHSAPVKRSSSAYRDFRIGQTYAIGYDPDDLSYVVVTDRRLYARLPLMLAFFGGVIVVFGLINRRKARRDNYLTRK